MYLLRDVVLLSIYPSTPFSLSLSQPHTQQRTMMLNNANKTDDGGHVDVVLSLLYPSQLTLFFSFFFLFFISVSGNLLGT